MDKKISFIKERVLQYADFKGIGKERFAKSIGMTYGSFKGSQKKTSLNSDALDNILSNYPDINSEWLITGNGEMVKNIKSNDVIIEPSKSYETPKAVTVDYAGKDNIVMVPIPAQAGYLNGLGDPQFMENLPAYRLPGLNNGTFRMFEVKGHSMYPTIHAGAVAVGEWCEDWKNNIKDNRIYIIVSRENGIVIKRCLNRIEKYGNLFLKSDNRAEYPSYPVNVEDILEVWELKTALIWNFQDPADLYDKVSDLEARLLHLENK